METSKKLLILSHSPCQDGTAAAWVVGRKFGFENVEFRGVNYGDPIPDVTDREVYIVDFSYPPAVLIPAAKLAKKIVMIDHHRTAQRQWEPVPISAVIQAWLTSNCPEVYGQGGSLYLIATPEQQREADRLPATLGYYLETLAPKPDNLEIVIRDDVAGTGAAWQYFFPNESQPPLLSAIDHRDRWIFDQFPQTREACEYCRAHGLTRPLLPNLLKLSSLIEDDEEKSSWEKYHEVADQGQAFVEFFDKFVSGTCESMQLVTLCGVEVPCVAIPSFYASEAGNLLSESHPFSITYSDNMKNGMRTFSLRSHSEYGADVEEIARKMGGGGHRHASGFRVPFTIDVKNATIQAMLDAQYARINPSKAEPIYVHV